MKNLEKQSKDIAGLLLKREYQSCIDIRYVALYLAKIEGKKRSNMQMLPILYNLVGEESFLMILRTFAGMNIRYPTDRSFYWAVRDVYIWNEVSKIDSKNRSERTKKFEELAKLFGLKISKIKSIYRKSDKILKDFPQFNIQP